MTKRDLHRPEIESAVQDYVRVAPNAHLGDNTPAEDRAFAEGIIFGHPQGPLVGIGHLADLTLSMEDM